MSLRFKKQKERLKVAEREQGLIMKNKKVFVKGQNRKKKTIAESLAFLQRNDEAGGILSTFPDGDVSEDEKKIRKMARKSKSVSAGGRRKTSSSLNALGTSTPKNKQKKNRNNHTSEHVNKHGGRGDRKRPFQRPFSHTSKATESVVPIKAPIVSDSDSGDSDSNDSNDSSECSLPSDFNMTSSDDDTHSVSSLSSSGLSSISSMGKGKKSTGPKHIKLDDSMSIISGVGGGSRNKGKSFGGLSKKESEESEKNDLLARFHILKQRGVHLSKNFSNKSSLNEMRMEMGRIEHENNVAKSIKINRRFFMASTSGLTKLTDGKYAPNLIRGKWHGFDKYVLNSIDDYDEPFERLSEHYGGVIGAITGGNPLWEIFVLFAYQFVNYGFMSDGGDQARAYEDMTADELKKRFPNLIKEAVEKEMGRKREEEYKSLRHEQFNQRAHLDAFDLQQRQALMQTPPPIAQIRPPSTSFHQLYPQQMHPPQQPPPPTTYLPRATTLLPERNNLNAENPTIAETPTMAQHNPQPSQHLVHMDGQFRSMNNTPVLSHAHDMDINTNSHEDTIVTINEPDPYMFAEMHAALPQIETEAPTNTIIGENYDISDSDDDILDTPVGTRDGRPLSLNKPPPNKRDNFEDTSPAPHVNGFTPFAKPSPAQVKATRDSGYVININ